MATPKKTLLIDIIDILASNGRQQVNIENIISDVETKFVAKGKSTRNLLNKIEDSIKVGTDLGLISSNEYNTSIRLKFNPHTRTVSVARILNENDDNINNDKNNANNNKKKRDGDNVSGNEMSESDKEYQVSDLQKNAKCASSIPAIERARRRRSQHSNHSSLSSVSSRRRRHSSNMDEMPKKRKSSTSRHMHKRRKY